MTKRERLLNQLRDALIDLDAVRSDLVEAIEWIIDNTQDPEP